MPLLVTVIFGYKTYVLLRFPVLQTLWQQDARGVAPDWHGIMRGVAFIGDPAVDKRLGCPADTHACFYAFDRDRPTLGVDGPRALLAGGTGSAATSAACAAVLSNCNQWGECLKRRDWCIMSGAMPDWLLHRFPEPWMQEVRTTYLFGRPDLLNPTHLVCLHYRPLVQWMTEADIKPGKLLMLWDVEESEGPGAYGGGLAEPLGDTAFLPLLRGPLVFQRIRMGEFGTFDHRFVQQLPFDLRREAQVSGARALRFPYHLKKMQLELQPDGALMRLAALVRQKANLDPNAFATRPHVVIVRRQKTRVLQDAEALRATLSTAGMTATILPAGTMNFKQQVNAVGRAAVMVAVHGADLMNMAWLPRGASVVEIAPVHDGYRGRTVMRKPDYFNIARLLGLRHLEYVSPSNATLLLDSSTGTVADWNHVNFVASVPINIPHLTAIVKTAIMAACGSCYEPCGPVDSEGRLQCLPAAVEAQQGL